MNTVGNRCKHYKTLTKWKIDGILKRALNIEKSNNSLNLKKVISYCTDVFIYLIDK